MTDDKKREIEHVINLRRYKLALLDIVQWSWKQFCVETYVSACVTFPEFRSCIAHTLIAFAKVVSLTHIVRRLPLSRHTLSGCNYFTARNDDNSCSSLQ